MMTNTSATTLCRETPNRCARLHPHRPHAWHQIGFTQTATLVALAAVLTLIAAPAHAQFVELDAGTRIRLRAPASVAGQLTGVVLARSGDSLTVSRSNAMPVTLPLSALTSLEISRGKSHGRGAMKGALWGGGIFLLLGLVMPMDDCTDGVRPRDCGEDSRAEGALFAATGGALSGALIGAIVGSERWERATLPLRVGLQPLSGGRVRLAFIFGAGSARSGPAFRGSVKLDSRHLAR